MPLRSWLSIALLFPFIVGCSAFDRSGGSAPEASVMTADLQADMDPDAVLADLKEGNRRFVSGRTTPRDLGAQVEATATGQYPKAVILGCLDSRVPPEMVFDQGIGDLFVGRVAGNFENLDLLGSMEFATKLAGSKLIVVLGHTECGAVKGAAAGAQLGNLTNSLENLEAAFEAARAELGRDPSDKDLVDRAVEENVRITVRDIQARSEVIREQVEAGTLAVVGAVYDLETGRVEWLD